MVSKSITNFSLKMTILNYIKKDMVKDTMKLKRKERSRREKLKEEHRKLRN